MTININTAYASSVKSSDLNNKFDLVFGENCILSGFDVVKTGDLSLKITPGIAVIAGASIQETEERVIGIQNASSPFIVMAYDHEKITVSLELRDSLPIIDSELLIGEIKFSNNVIYDIISPKKTKSLFEISELLSDTITPESIASSNVKETSYSGFAKIGEIDFEHLMINNSQIKLKGDSIAYLNGFKVVIPDGEIINLTDAPLYNERTDFIYLEMFIDKSNTSSINYKLVCIDDIDTSKYKRVFIDSHTKTPDCDFSDGILPLGIISDDKKSYSFINIGKLSNGDLVSDYLRPINNTIDNSLYVSGRGRYEDKELLGSLDGYIYALPMFFINRKPTAVEFSSFEHSIAKKITSNDKIITLNDSIAAPLNKFIVRGPNLVSSVSDSDKFLDIGFTSRNLLGQYRVIETNGTFNECSNGYSLTMYENNSKCDIKYQLESFGIISPETAYNVPVENDISYQLFANYNDGTSMAISDASTNGMITTIAGEFEDLRSIVLVASYLGEIQVNDIILFGFPYIIKNTSSDNYLDSDLEHNNIYVQLPMHLGFVDSERFDYVDLKEKKIYNKTKLVNVNDLEFKEIEIQGIFTKCIFGSDLKGTWDDSCGASNFAGYDCAAVTTMSKDAFAIHRNGDIHIVCRTEYAGTTEESFREYLELRKAKVIGLLQTELITDFVAPYPTSFDGITNIVQNNNNELFTLDFSYLSNDVSNFKNNRSSLKDGSIGMVIEGNTIINGDGSSISVGEQEDGIIPMIIKNTDNNFEYFAEIKVAEPLRRLDETTFDYIDSNLEVKRSVSVLKLSEIKNWKVSSINKKRGSAVLKANISFDIPDGYKCNDAVRINKSEVIVSIDINSSVKEFKKLDPSVIMKDSKIEILYKSDLSSSELEYVDMFGDLIFDNQNYEVNVKTAIKPFVNFNHKSYNINLDSFSNKANICLESSVTSDFSFSVKHIGETGEHAYSGNGFASVDNVDGSIKKVIIKGATVGGHDTETGFSHTLSSVGETYDTTFSKPISSDEIIAGHDGFKGEINNLRIKGTTVGGYDAKTGFSHALSSVGETYDATFSKPISSDEIITGHDGFRGEINNLRIKGATVGGYDAKTGFSHALSSVGETYDATFSKPISSDEIITGHDGFRGEINNLRIKGATVGGYDAKTGFSHALSSVGETYDATFSKPISSDEIIAGHDGFRGEINNLKILGNTTGGYNPELSTSFPLQSVGEKENGLIVARTCGKNLFDKSNIKKIKGYFTDNTVIAGDASTRTLYLRIKKNTGYVITPAIELTRFNVATTNEENPLIGSKVSNIVQATGKVSARITTGSDSEFLLVYYSNAGDLENLDIQIEEGDISTEYEPYQESVVQVQLPASMGSLKGIGSVQDEVDFNGKIVQKCLMKEFKGLDSEGWSFVKKDTNTTFFRISSFSPKSNCLRMSDIKSNKMLKLTDSSDISTSDIQCILIGNDLNLRILNSNLETQDLQGLKKLLQKWESEGDSLKIIYQANEPIIHEITPAQKLSTFKTITTLSCGNSVQPTSMTGTATFFPLQSVGQAENGLIVARTCGKNLINENALTRGAVNPANGEIVVSSNASVNKEKIKVKGDIYLQLNDFKGKGVRVSEYNNNTFIKSQVFQSNRHIVLDNETDGVRVNGEDIVMLNNKLMVSNISTEYEEYKESVVQVQLPFEGGLKSLTNNVSDVLSYSENKIYEKCELLKLKDLVWGVDNYWGEDETYISFSSLRSGNNTFYGSKNNVFPIKKEPKGLETGMVFGTNLGLTIERSYLETDDVAGLIKLLTSNNGEIVKERLNHVIHELPTQQKLSTFKTITHLSCDNSVQPKEPMTGTATFSPLESVDEKENGMIVARTIGKNLIGTENKYFNFKKGVTGLAAGVTVGLNNSLSRCVIVIKAKDNTTYTANSKNTNIAIVTSFKDGTFKADTGWRNSQIITGTNTGYIYVSIRKNDNSNWADLNEVNRIIANDNIQVEEGNISTDYEAYQESVVQVQLPFNGGLKEFDCIHHNKITEGSKSITFNGDENWELGNEPIQANTMSFRLLISDSEPVKTNGDLISNRFSTNFNLYINDIEGVTIYKEKYIVFRILRTKLESEDINGFKKWVRSNNIEVVYKLAASIIHEIPPQKLSTFKTITHLTCDNSVQPKEPMIGTATFFPLESVGQSENGLIVARTFGKNLVLLNSSTIYSTSALLNGNTLRNKKGALSPILKISGMKVGTTYTFSTNLGYEDGNPSGSQLAMCLRYENLYYESGAVDRVKTVTGTPNSISVTFTAQKSYIHLIGGITTTVFTNIQLEKGNISTDYEPYQESVAQVQLPESMSGLKCVGSLQDEVNFGGKIVQKFSEIIFDGEEDFGDGGYTSISGNYINIKYVTDVFDRGAILCDKLPTTDWANLVEKNYEYITQSTVQQRCILFNILKSKLPTPDINGFKQWLKTNPLKVIYQLKESIAHEIPTQKLPTIKTITHLSCDNSVKPKEPMTGTATFSPLESVAQSENGLVVAKTTGKNLFNKSQYNLNTPHEVISGRRFCRIQLKPNAAYTISVTSVDKIEGLPNGWVWISQDKDLTRTKRIYPSISGGNSILLNSGQDGNLWFVYSNPSILEQVMELVSDLQIEEGNISTLYEEYRESYITSKINKCSDFMDAGIAKINDLRDELNCEDGILTKRIGIINSFENIKIFQAKTTDKTVQCYIKLPNSKKSYDSVLLSNKFTSCESVYGDTNIDSKHGLVYSWASGFIYFNIPRDELLDISSDSIKYWFIQNNVQLYYPLDNEVKIQTYSYREVKDNKLNFAGQILKNKSVIGYYDFNKKLSLGVSGLLKNGEVVMIPFFPGTKMKKGDTLISADDVFNFESNGLLNISRLEVIDSDNALTLKAFGGNVNMSDEFILAAPSTLTTPYDVNEIAPLISLKGIDYEDVLRKDLNSIVK